MVTAMKVAENSDEIIIRLRDVTGQPNTNKYISFGADLPIISAREVNGQEETLGEAEIVDGVLQFSLTPFQPKAFALTIANKSKITLKQLTSQSVPLPFTAKREIQASVSFNRFSGWSHRSHFHGR